MTTPTLSQQILASGLQGMAEVLAELCEWARYRPLGEITWTRTQAILSRQDNRTWDQQFAGKEAAKPEPPTKSERKAEFLRLAQEAGAGSSSSILAGGPEPQPEKREIVWLWREPPGDGMRLTHSQLESEAIELGGVAKLGSFTAQERWYRRRVTAAIERLSKYDAESAWAQLIDAITNAPTAERRDPEPQQVDAERPEACADGKCTPDLVEMCGKHTREYEESLERRNVELGLGPGGFVKQPCRLYNAPEPKLCPGCGKPFDSPDHDPRCSSCAESGTGPEPEPFEPMECCGRERDKDGGPNPHCECPALIRKPRRLYTAPEVLPVGALLSIEELGDNSESDAPDLREGDRVIAINDTGEPQQNEIRMARPCEDDSGNPTYYARGLGNGTYVSSVRLIEEAPGEKPKRKLSPMDELRKRAGRPRGPKYSITITEPELHALFEEHASLGEVWDRLDYERREHEETKGYRQHAEQERETLRSELERVKAERDVYCKELKLQAQLVSAGYGDATIHDWNALQAKLTVAEQKLADAEVAREGALKALDIFAPRAEETARKLREAEQKLDAFDALQRLFGEAYGMMHEPDSGAKWPASWDELLARAKKSEQKLALYEPVIAAAKSWRGVWPQTDAGLRQNNLKLAEEIDRLLPSPMHLWQQNSEGT